MLVGMDEVGRGSWAGPVVVGAVILADEVPGLRDSKLLSRRQRERLDGTIRSRAAAWSLGQASPEEIDTFGLTAALSMAFTRALSGLSVGCDEIVIDGNYNFLAGDDRVRVIVDADALVPAVSAASIIAKVARDALMAQAALVYPGYGFETHVGYGTAGHAAALAVLGISPLHRRSFAPIRNMKHAALIS